MKKIILFISIIFCFSKIIYSQAGELDSSFGTNGIAEIPTIDGNYFSATAIQTDGKIVVAGHNFTTEPTIIDFLIFRYNNNGTLDSSFSENGIQTTDFGSFEIPAAVAIQPDGKIVVAGYTFIESSNAFLSAVLARYNIDGSLDNTFSDDGKQTLDFENYRTAASSMAVQSDGKIVLSCNLLTNDGNSGGVALARFNSDGGLDNSFSEDGKLISDIGTSSNAGQKVAIQTDGKIVVTGRADPGGGSFALARYYTNGSLDTTFSEDGIQITDFGPGDDYANSVAIQSDGKIVVAGNTWNMNTFSTNFALARFNTDGSLDNTFSDDGKQTTAISSMSTQDEAHFLAIQSDGKIIVGGFTFNGSVENSTTNAALARYNIDGSLDTAFSDDGIQTNDRSSSGIFGLAIFKNKLYALDFKFIARYLLDDDNKAPTITLTTPTNNATYIAPANVKLTATATDEDGTISKVEFYNGTHLLHTDYLAPYSFKWCDVPAGNYTLTAKATDNSGLVTTSAAVHISIVSKKAPTVRIIKPHNNQSFAAPAYTRLKANAKDRRRITRVEFYNGTKLLRTEYKHPYKYVWKKVPAGTYTITAKAYNDKGLSATSKAVKIKVKNNASIVSRSSSTNVKTDLNDALSLRLSPVPARSTLQIYTKGLQLNRPSTISVLSSTGVLLKTIQSNASNKVVQLDVSSLVSGVYTIKVINGEKVAYKQFVKL